MGVDQATLDGTRPTSRSDGAETTASKRPVAACDRGIIQQGDSQGRAINRAAPPTQGR
jgi:hypothetical protein